MSGTRGGRSWGAWAVAVLCALAVAGCGSRVGRDRLERSLGLNGVGPVANVTAPESGAASEGGAAAGDSSGAAEPPGGGSTPGRGASTASGGAAGPADRA